MFVLRAWSNGLRDATAAFYFAITPAIADRSRSAPAEEDEVSSLAVHFFHFFIFFIFSFFHFFIFSCFSFSRFPTFQSIYFFFNFFVFFFLFFLFFSFFFVFSFFHFFTFAPPGALRGASPKHRFFLHKS